MCACSGRGLSQHSVEGRIIRWSCFSPSSLPVLEFNSGGQACRASTRACWTSSPALWLLLVVSCSSLGCCFLWICIIFIPFMFGTCALAVKSGGQRTTCVSPSITWVLGIQPRSSGLVAIFLTLWAISPVLLKRYRGLNLVLCGCYVSKKHSTPEPPHRPDTLWRGSLALRMVLPKSPRIAGIPGLCHKPGTLLTLLPVVSLPVSILLRS